MRTTLIALAFGTVGSYAAHILANASPQRPFSLSDVHATEYDILSHPAYPTHAVRIRRARDFCDTTVRAYTGYVDIGMKHLFFYFFESRRDPESDDVVMWINGGPGGTAAVGMLMELGPCHIMPDNKTVSNPFSWTNKANMLFLDQPVGTGFSYSDDGESASTTEDAAKDIATFFAILSATLPQFQGRRLHLAGESYAGHMLPIFAAEILDQNMRLKELGQHGINVNSVIIGNGLINLYHMITSAYDMQCSNASGRGVIQTSSACVGIRRALPRCQHELRQSCQEKLDHRACEAAFRFCESTVVAPFLSLGLNPYDISKRCTYGNGEDETGCYPEFRYIDTYLNAPATRATLRTDRHPAHVDLVSPTVRDNFWASGDWFRPSHLHLGSLLDRGVRVLVYAGGNDMECSWVGIERAADDITWNGQGDWAKAALQEWFVNGNVAGVARESGGLSFVRIDNAGHFAPQDKPTETLEMIGRWLEGRSIVY